MPRDRAGSSGSCSGGNRAHHKHGGHQDHTENRSDPNRVYCCVPTGCDRGDIDDGVILLDDLHGVVRVLCNNEQCPNGQYMHNECFEAWEQTVLTYLRSTGRARSWSEKQRLQNLWTKKGYDLAFKACGCKCGKGHLRKDLNWMAPPPKDGVGAVADDRRKKNRKKNRNERPGLFGSPPSSGGMNSTGSASGCVAVASGGNISTAAASSAIGANRDGRPMLRLRSNSMSSTGSTSGSSPPSSASTGESPISPSHFAMAMALGGGARRRSSARQEFFPEIPEASCSIFARRADYSSFNSLPRHKINSYHIKMEDSSSSGNDETRGFVLSSLAAAHVNRVQCVLCQCQLPIYDEYPLIDGTFFLSPRQHSNSCLPIKADTGQVRQFLCVVCMGCLEGWSAALRCRFCAKQWCGTSLMLGTMYSYDIFASDPCCIERLKCNRCHKLVVLAEQRCSYYSDYSSCLPCPHCGYLDHHFVKELATYYLGLE